MKHLYNKVHDGAAFENVFWVTVSKECSIHELQNKIARALKVPDLFKDVDEGMRPPLLFNHLSEKKKRLVILDDMWQHFELADVGIPVKRDGVHLVLTTRYLGGCKKMLCQVEVGVRPLSDEEAWALLVQTLGSDLPPSRKLVAEDKECERLPLAIVVMAGSMRGEVEDHLWEATLENSKRPGVLEQSMKKSVFPILVHSYNRLDKKKQLSFLTCALYLEDWSKWNLNLTRSWTKLQALKVGGLRSLVRPAIISQRVYAEGEGRSGQSMMEGDGTRMNGD
ncbi:disease resistance protein At4g27190-like [Punica granatum]|uniref:Disease resistance protein At4g27190-like n=2 Tax=Punica granatum TaxID=22663 RepID=A0A6P8CNA2_PUNGR|nr:disease resistance protein At4g27190-like [Punica granatum]